MKIGFISFPVPGHFNPMSALARQLQSRSHDVVMFSLPVGESLARAADLPFVPFGEEEFSAEHSSEVVGIQSRLKGEEIYESSVLQRAWMPWWSIFRFSRGNKSHCFLGGHRPCGQRHFPLIFR